MKRSKLVLPFIKTALTRPRTILKTLYHGMAEMHSMDIARKKYRKENGLAELDLLNFFGEFQETVEPFTHLYGTSLPIDIAILKKIAKSIPNCEYLEIGSWRGESLANIAPHCSRCVSISLSDQEMRNIGLDDTTISLQRFFSKKHANINHIGANSMTFDFSTIGKFDLIFVDGDHRFEAVVSDTINAFKLLKDNNSIIVWHDYTKNYEQINWEVLAGILAGAPDSEREKIYHITNSLLAIYTTQPVTTKPYTFPSIPNKIFTLDIKAQQI